MKPVAEVVPTGSTVSAGSGPVVELDAPIPTWFGIGGRARRLARPSSVEELRACVLMDPALRVLGDGANLLVDDDGVDELVVALTAPVFTRFGRDSKSGRFVGSGGANLPKMINEAVRQGLSGIEGLAGIPATIGGAAVMNAGGAFGQLADTVVRVTGIDRLGKDVTLERDEIDFSYRHSGLGRDQRTGRGLIITAVELDLQEEDPAALRARQKEVMEYKKRSQPMADRSAGCVFKNPTLPHDVPSIGPAGERVSAGMLIDRAGCKGLRSGGASVSPRHANFVVTDKDAKARDVTGLMGMVTRMVNDTFGVTLEPEVVVWRKDGAP